MFRFILALGDIPDMIYSDGYVPLIQIRSLLDRENSRVEIREAGSLGEYFRLAIICILVIYFIEFYNLQIF